MGLETDPDLEETEAGMVGWVWREISSSYVNIGLTVAILYLLYKILFAKEEEDPVVAVEPPLPPVKKQVRLRPPRSQQFPRHGRHYLHSPNV